MNTIFLNMKNPSFISFRILCNWFGVCVDEIPISFQSTTMSGQFSYALMMSIMGGIVLSFPFIFYQIWAFVKPGLKKNEKSVMSGLVFWVSFLFFLGILFGYFIGAPLCVQFFGVYKISNEIENIFTISSYLSTILSTVTTESWTVCSIMIIMIRLRSTTWPRRLRPLASPLRSLYTKSRCTKS
jgi:sec-independent protein translocase protein TatC